MTSISNKYSYNKNYIVWWVYVLKSYFLSLEEVFFWINSSKKVNNSSNSPFKCKDGLKIYLLSEKNYVCLLITQISSKCIYMERAEEFYSIWNKLTYIITSFRKTEKNCMDSGNVHMVLLHLNCDYSFVLYQVKSEEN